MNPLQIIWHSAAWKDCIEMPKMGKSRIKKEQELESIVVQRNRFLFRILGSLLVTQISSIFALVNGVIEYGQFFSAESHAPNFTAKSIVPSFFYPPATGFSCKQSLQPILETWEDVTP